MSPVGIAIVTYNRLPRMRRLVAQIRALTTSPFELVVADDGSTDGTANWCRAEGVRVVTGRNRGVCWNKNRGLYALAALGCDPILLLEDDSRPVEPGWEAHWRHAAALWGHVCFAHAKIDDGRITGTGTADDPIVSFRSTAQCAAISASSLARLGYFDTRFEGYGIGHSEWTERAKRLGFGFKPAAGADGRPGQASLYIHGGLEADDAPSFRDNEAVMQNRALYELIRDEPPYRTPWSDAQDRDAFLKEQTMAGITAAPETIAPEAPARPSAGKLDPQGLARVREELRKRLPGFRLRTFVEVGAHLGESVQAVRSLFPDARVHAFEPVPDTHAELAKAFAGDERVTTFGLALGAEEGTVVLQTRGTSPGAHVVAKPAAPPRYVSAPRTTGDRWLKAQGLTGVSYLRIDTMGSELDILAGFQHALADFAVAVIEVAAALSPENPRHVPLERLKAYLEPMGYRLFSIRNQTADKSGALIHCSLVFVSRPLLGAQAAVVAPD